VITTARPKDTTNPDMTPPVPFPYITSRNIQEVKKLNAEHPAIFFHLGLNRTPNKSKNKKVRKLHRPKKYSYEL
jgi:hypothetical protein